jgi:hypothetical protein
MLRNGVMTLFARTCSRLAKNGVQLCRACQLLQEDKTLEGILTRIEKGTHENANYAYYGFSALSELLRRRTQQFQISELRGLTQAKKLLSMATVLSDQKRLLLAIASGKVNRVDRLLSIGLRQKKGVRGLLASYVAAAEGHYRPKSFTEEEDMKALLLWKLGGNRIAQINHRANEAPSVSYLRTRSNVPPIVPSPKQPTVKEVETNVDATLCSVLDVVHDQIKLKVLHTVVMFDEIATEKRIRWDPKTNFFLGVCRQHASKTSMEFVNEGDMEELFRCLDDGIVHYAAEVRQSRDLFPHRETVNDHSILGHGCRFGNFMQRQSHLPWPSRACIWGLQTRNRKRARPSHSNCSHWCEQPPGHNQAASCLHCVRWRKSSGSCIYPPDV